MPQIATDSLFSLLSNTPSSNPLMVQGGDEGSAVNFKQFMMGEGIDAGVGLSPKGAVIAANGKSLPVTSMLAASGKAILSQGLRDASGKALPSVDILAALENLPDNSVIAGLPAVGGGESADLSQLMYASQQLGLKLPALLQENMNKTQGLIASAEPTLISGDVVSDEWNLQAIDIESALPSDMLTECDQVLSSASGVIPALDIDNPEVLQAFQALLPELPEGSVVGLTSDSALDLEGLTPDEAAQTVAEWLVDARVVFSRQEALPEELIPSTSGILRDEEEGAVSLPLVDVLAFVPQQTAWAPQLGSDVKDLLNDGVDSVDQGRFDLVTPNKVNVALTRLLDQVNQQYSQWTRPIGSEEMSLSTSMNSREFSSTAAVTQSLQASFGKLLQQEVAAKSQNTDTLRQIETMLSGRSSDIPVSYNVGSGHDAIHISGVQHRAEMSANPAPLVGQKPVDEQMLLANRQEWHKGLNERIQWMLSQNVQKADIRIDPPELGTIHIRVHQHGDQTQVVFSSPHANVRETLEQAIPRLREMFEQQGMNLGQADVRDQQGGQSERRDAEASQLAGDNIDNDIQDTPTVVAASSSALVDTHV